MHCRGSNAGNAIIKFNKEVKTVGKKEQNKNTKKHSTIGTVIKTVLVTVSLFSVAIVATMATVSPTVFETTYNALIARF